jgi:PAS domain S-box-containing protein
MASHGLIFALLGLTVIIIILSRKAGVANRSLKKHLPEMTVGAYLLIQGIATSISYFAIWPISGGQVTAILLLLPAAISASRIHSDYNFSRFSVILWLLSGVAIACFDIIQIIYMKQPVSPLISASFYSGIYLVISIIAFRGMNWLILAVSSAIWTIDLVGLPEPAIFGAGICLGAVTLIKMTNIFGTSSDEIFAFSLKELLKSIPEPYAILDQSGVILSVNDAFLDVSEYNRDTLIRTEAVELFDIPSDWRFKTNPAEGRKGIYCHLLCKSGKRIPVLLKLNEINNSKRKLSALLCTIHNEKERETLESRLKSESARFSSLYETSMALSSSLEMKDVLKAIAAAAENLTRADSCVIFSLDRVRQIIQPIFSSDEAFNAEVMNFQLAVGHGLTGTVVSDGKPRIQNCDAQLKMSVHVPGTKDEEDESLMAVPLMAKDAIIGALTLYKIGSKRFEEEDIKILTIFASQASAVIENSRLFMKLKASEKLYRFSVDQAGDAIFFVDPETGKINDSNETSQKLIKYNKANLSLMHIWELQPEPQMHITKRLWQEINKIGWGKLGEIDYQAQNGSKISASVNASIIYTGDVASIQWIVRDLSEYKRALERAGFLQQIFEQLGEPIFLTDTKGRCLYGNESFCEIFGASKDQITKGDIFSLSMQNSAFEILRGCWEELRGKDYLVDEIKIGSNGTSTKMISILPFKADQGGAKYFIWFFTPPFDSARVKESQASMIA